MEFINANNEVTAALGNGLLSDFFPIFEYIKLPYDIKFEGMLNTFFKLFNVEFESHREKFDPGKEMLRGSVLRLVKLKAYLVGT